MQFDRQRVEENAREATTPDLLDRVTVYRAGMEPEALTIIEDELRARGVSAERIAAHAEERGQEIIPLPDGTAAPCSFCHRPAVEQRWGWHWLSLMVLGERRGLLPIWPRFYSYCALHRPATRVEDAG